MTLIAAHRPLYTPPAERLADSAADAAESSASRVVMCPPVCGLGLAAPDLHAWGPRPVAFDCDRALRQWESLRDAIVSLGIGVDLLVADGSLRAQMAVGDAALVVGSQALAARFADDDRTGECPVVGAALAASGLEIVTPPSDVVFEAGQAIASDLTLFGGWFARRERLGLRWAARTLQRRLVDLRLQDETLDRLDLCLRPLRPEIALCVPEAFDAADFTTLRDQITLLLPVPTAEAIRGACSALVFGTTVILPTECPRTAALLDTAGFRVVAVDVSEFAKLGCGLSRLVLPLG